MTDFEGRLSEREGTVSRARILDDAVTGEYEVRSEQVPRYLADAALDLYAACVALLATKRMREDAAIVDRGIGTNTPMGRAIIAARAAISKATGVAPSTDSAVPNEEAPQVQS